MGKFLFSHRKVLWGLFALGVIFLYFHYLQAAPLIDPDEGRYHEIPREMLLTGDFITPRLNGVLYFEKPILQYWFTAFFMYVFGINEMAGRIYPALATVSTIFLTAYLGSKLFTWRVGLLSAGIFATSALTVAVGSMNILDMGLTMYLTASLASYFLYKQKYERKFIYIFYGAMALGLLQKGLIAIILPGLIILGDIILNKQWRMFKEIFYWRAVVLALVIAFPWFILVARANQDFLYFFFIHEHFLRYATKIHQRFHPWWFFLPFIFLGLTPWTGYLVSLFSKQGIIRSATKEERNKINYLLLWFGVILLFFSCSDSKLVPYIMPCFVPLAIILAASLRRCDHLKQWLGKSLWANCLWAIIFAVALIYVEHFYTDIDLGEIKGRLYPLMVLMILMPFVLAGAYRYFKRIRCVCTVTFLCGFVMVLALQYLQVGIYQRESAYEVSKVVMNMKHKPTLIVHYGDFYHSMAFYTRERIGVADFTGELEFGSKYPEAQNYFYTGQQLADLWKSDNRIIIVVKAEHLAKCKQYIQAPIYMEQVQDYYLLSNQNED